MIYHDGKRITPQTVRNERFLKTGVDFHLNQVIISVMPLVKTLFSAHNLQMMIMVKNFGLGANNNQNFCMEQ
ncbi:MAG: hypothetical protein RRY34_07790 [Victivallaceae bacterium]